MNIDDKLNELERLKKLKDKGALTQEEFDDQVTIYLDSVKASSDTNKKSLGDKVTNSGGLKVRHFIYSGLIFIVIYISVEKIFPDIILCKEGVSEAKCNCIRQKIARKVNFLDKIKILAVGGSREELASYLDWSDGFSCGMED